MLQNPEPPLILASASASRNALLTAAGLTFTTQPAHINEAEVKLAAQTGRASPDDAAILLADLKAQRIARREPDALVIGADQILVCGERWFDKPANLTEAREQLLALRGRPHTLITAVVCRRAGQRLWQHIERPSLTMRRFSYNFLDAYLAAEGAETTATVGAYRLEQRGVHLFDAVAGEHSAILGLPLLPLLGFLRQHGVLSE